MNDFVLATQFYTIYVGLVNLPSGKSSLSQFQHQIHTYTVLLHTKTVLMLKFNWLTTLIHNQSFLENVL